MSYLVLYREWRPQSFKEIVGQDHITRTLQNALTSGRVGHAYLFTGPRGTGKTTMAKVLAKALNCRLRQSADPCNNCENCREITAGSSMDVIEIDAASHRGIDEIRDLREKVRFSPTSGIYRVYIIDEVHMLTAEAFNALLKTLEEPPSHIVFILATTEPHKVPLTILSRCQRFDFHRIGMQPLLDRLREVAGKAGLEVEDKALYLIARAAEGGLRDALSILDQAAVFGEKRITAEDIHRILGTVREKVLDDMTFALEKGDIVGALVIIKSLVEQGKDLRPFVRELLSHMRNLLLLLLSPDMEEELSPSEKERLTAQAKALGQDRLLSFLNILNRTEQEMRWSTQPGVLLEVALVQAVRSADRGDGADLKQRVARLEYLMDKLADDRSGGRPEHIRAEAGTGEEEDKKPPAEQAAKKIPTDGEPAGKVMETAGEDRLRRKPAATHRKNASKDNAVHKKIAHQEKIEDRQVSSTQVGPVQDSPSQNGPAQDDLAQEKKPKKTDAVISPPGDDSVFQEIVSRWADFLDNLKRIDIPTYMFLSRGWPQQLSGNLLTIAFVKEDDIFKKHLENNPKVISSSLATFFMQDWKVRLTHGERPPEAQSYHTNKKLSPGETLTLFGIPEEEDRKEEKL